MASIFGVGVPYSSIVPEESGLVEVTQIGKAAWEQSWTESNMKDGKLALFCAREAEGDGKLSTITPCMITLSSKEVAERLGVGVQGMSLMMDEPETRSRLSNDFETVESLEWVKSLFQLLKSFSEDYKSLGQGKEVENPREADTVDRAKKGSVASTLGLNSVSTVERLPSQSEMFKQSTGDKQGEQSLTLENAQSKKEKQGKLLQLTIKIFLDPSTQELFHQKSKERVHFDEQNRVLDVRGPDFALQGDVVGSSNKIYRFQESDFEMAPQVIITFFSEPNPSGKLRSKRFRTLVAVDFCIEDSSPTPEEFGWYHDNLRLAFKCTEGKPAAVVRREIKDVSQELLSRHKRKSFERSHEHQYSSARLKGTNGGLKITGVHKVDTPITVTMLEEANLSIKKSAGKATELAYKAVFFPPLESCDIWNPRSRRDAVGSGTM
ncbi:hypothetical protein R1flu_004388 [Riccia fluitans]|uniref:Uncharacterized protein n=1 Tax=Riccia fluitans TaxID=41844 RepID=A0ABD1YR51_9MARC